MKKIIKDFVENYGEIVCEVVNNVPDILQKKFLQDSHILAKRSVSSLINDYMFYGLKKILQNLPDFKILELDRNKRFILYRNTLLIKIKKFDDNLKASFIETKSAKDFHHQKEIENVPRAKNIYLGYILNKFNTAIIRIAFAYPNEYGGYEWIYDIPYTIYSQQMVMFPEEQNKEFVLPKKRIKIKKEIERNKKRKKFNL